MFSVVEYDSLGVYRQEGEDENGKYELIYELSTNYMIVITDQALEVAGAGKGFIKEGNIWYTESKYSPIDPLATNELDGDRIGFKTMDFAPYYYTSGEASSMAGEIERLFAWPPPIGRLQRICFDGSLGHTAGVAIDVPSISTLRVLSAG